jgi:methyltransferase (TIGR00027 family)
MRSDNDTWDITESVGSTALFVATARALEAQKPDPLAVDPYAEVFVRAAGGDWADVLDGKDPDNVLARPATGEAPDFGAYFASFQGARTRYFDEYFARAAEAGVRQIVLLAAGLDARAYRLEWPTGTDIYEIDQPRVLAFKRDVLTERGESTSAARHEIAVDLREDWPSAVRAAGFDPALPSAWLAEGLLMYLPATAQEQLFSGIDSLAAPTSRVAVEEQLPMPAELLELKRQEERAADGRNTFFTLIYNERHAPADEYFAGRGWATEATVMIEYLERLGVVVPDDAIEARSMLQSSRLVSGTKL